jgi:hypothetical protein
LTVRVRGGIIAPMRTVIAAAITALFVLLPVASRAEGPILIELTVGESSPVGGFRPLCDDPAIAAFAADGSGRLQGLKPGETTCSVSRSSPLGPRQVYRIVVRPPAKGGGGKGGAPAGG